MCSSDLVNYFNAAHRTTAEIDGKSQLVWELDSELALEVGEDGTTFTFPKDEYFTITIAGDVDYPIHSGKLAVHVDKAVKPATPIISGVDWVDVICLLFANKGIKRNADNTNVVSFSFYL